MMVNRKADLFLVFSRLYVQYLIHNTEIIGAQSGPGEGSIFVSPNLLVAHPRKGLVFVPVLSSCLLEKLSFSFVDFVSKYP